jgi:hypothetical protein
MPRQLSHYASLLVPMVHSDASSETRVTDQPACHQVTTASLPTKTGMGNIKNKWKLNFRFTLNAVKYKTLISINDKHTNISKYQNLSRKRKVTFSRKFPAC